MILNRRYRGKIEKIPLPVQNGTLTYNGNAQSPVWLNYDSTKVTMGGVTSSVNAGTFTATFTPKKSCCWEDGSRDAKNVTWSIGKAAGSLSLSVASLSLSDSNKTKTVTVTRSGDGAVTAISSDTNVAIISVSGTTLTITAKKSGSAVITVKVAASANYTAPADKTISISASITPPLIECTAAKVQEVARSGQAPNVWSVGDKIPIKLSGTVGALTLNDTYYAFIIGFNHNSGIEGNNTIHFQFGKTADGTDIAFCDAGYGNVYNDNTSARFVMNTFSTKTGGWKDSYMRNTICPAFLNAMPSVWQNVITSCVKYSDNVGSGSDTASYVTSTSDKIWLLAEFELCGTRTYANSAEKTYQRQYDYYKNGNSKIKHRHIDTSALCAWRLRSFDPSGVGFFCSVNAAGYIGSYNASLSYGFVPCFMVA